MLTLLNKNEGGIVVFHIWKTLNYKYRILLSLSLILIGLAWQIATFEYLPGLLFLIAGNLFLLTRGYTNKVDLGGYHPEAEWQKTEASRLDEILKLNKKIRQWNFSLFDISSAGGFIFMLLIIVLLVALGFISYKFQSRPLGLLAVDAFILLIPHWYTGLRRIMTTPKLVQKIKIFQELIADVDVDENSEIQYLMLLAGEKTKVPKDLKIKIDFQPRPEGFLGLYGQVNINEVQGKEYPYYYMVLVTKTGIELKQSTTQYISRGKFILEFQIKNDIQTMVIRQYTTKNSGYFTDTLTRRRIYKDSLSLTKKIFKLQ